MATKILYSNKIVLQNDETIPSENKVTADDMNEIKEVVNNNADELETKQGKEEGKGLSTNDFTDELKEKLESLENYDDTELKQKNTEQDTTIEELKAENIELKAENERLNNDINAISVTEKAEGENITLNDTAEARFKSFGIGGNSWQKTRSGKNIINITSVSSNDKASFDNETKEATLLEGFKGTFYLYFPETTFKSGKTYLIEIFLSKSTTNSKQVEFLLKYDDNKFTDNWLNINSSSNYYVASYTPSEDIIANRFQVYGSSTNIVDGEIKFKVQIRENTTESGYEDYGAMPSTNYKSDIQNVTGNANVTICNKNLFVVEKFIEDLNSLFQGEEIYNNKNCIKIARVQTTDTTYTYHLKCKENTQYSLKLETTSAGNNSYIYLVYSDGSKTNILNRDASTKLEEILVTTDKNKTLIGLKFCCYGWNNYWYINKDSVQIEENTEATDYTEHKEQSFTFPLVEDQRLMLNDYLADDGIHYKRKQIVLTGREDEWVWADTTRYALKIDNAKDGNGLCNQFKYNEYSATGKIDNTFNITNGYVGFYITSITSLTAFKNYLAEQYANGTPVVIEYELETEEIEPYTEEQQVVYNEIKKTAHSYGEQTHIFCTDETSLIFSVEARKDMNTVISNLESMILANASEEV